MHLKEKGLSSAIRVIFSSGLAISSCWQIAHAQQAEIQKVEVTGSSIKRVAVEGSLPIQTLTRDMIEQSGASTAADLIATLPIMQDFLSAGSSINGGGGGRRTANIHGVGQGYTLILLNGRRMAPYGTGSSVNLDSIPFSAIERIEILTDGASTLYGSDAIGGVINFILKKDSQDGGIELALNRPQAGSHGSTKNFAISKGFGDLDKDKYNLLLSYSHDESTHLDANERDFSKTGIVPYTVDGKKYAIVQSSSNSSPANITVRDKSNKTVTFNPNLMNTGQCPVAGSFILGNICRFDYASVVQLMPDMKRDALFATFNYQITPEHRFFADVMMSNFTSSASFAPPAHSQNVDINSALFKNNIVPLLSKFGMTPDNVKNASYNFRLTDAGRRTDDWVSKAKHLAMGLEGKLKGWEYSLAYTHSESQSLDNVNGGFVDGLMYDDLIAKGTFNPFTAPDAQTKTALAPAVVHLTLNNSKSKIDMLNLHASTDLFQMNGGTAQLGVGGDYQKKEYANSPDPIAQGPNQSQPNYANVLIGSGGSGALPFDTTRNNWGGFAELILPFSKQLEVTTAIRFDRYNKALNSKNFDPDGNLIAPAEQGAQYNSGTFKLSAAYRPVENLLLRASFGSGIQAPTLDNITSPLTYGGNTGSEYPCPVSSGPLLPLCNGTTYYGILSGGNPTSGDRALKSEKSKQYSIGFRIDPSKELSIGFDMYKVAIRDQLTSLDEEEVFTHPQKYQSLFSSYYDSSAKSYIIVAPLTVINRYSSLYQGIDWDHSYKTKTSLGKLTLNWMGSYLIKNESSMPGQAADGYIGKWNGGSAIFRWLSHVSATLQVSDTYTHTLNMNYHPGYHDKTWTVDSGIARAVNADGSYGAEVESARDVSSYLVWDWQTKMNLNKHISIIGGIKNIFNKNPPYAQGTMGNMYGYNSGYTDPLGRQFRIRLNYKF